MMGDVSMGWREVYRAAVLASLDRLKEARTATANYTRMVPNGSIGMVARAESYVDGPYLAQLLSALRKAGLPE
jgi:hypothetical protein